jgi:membrane associated rhomboid family serine protease
MFSSIWEDIKREFRQGNMITRLIIVNVSVYVLLNIAKFIIRLRVGFDVPRPEAFDTLMKYLALNDGWFFNLTHPWVFFTSMFLHEGFWHLLFNMLFLYWFGRIVGDLLGNQRILPLYLMGGLAGGFLYLITAGWLYPGGSIAYGASAAVMAIVAAAGTVAPDYIMRVLLIGDVRLKYIVGVLIFLDVVAVTNMSNTGGSLAHLGGAAFGFLFVRQLRTSGRDWSAPVNNVLDRIFEFFSAIFQSSPKRPKVVYKNPNLKKKSRTRPKRSSDGRGRKAPGDSSSYQEKLDSILDKIKQKGYESLTEEEKEFLFNASKK